MLTGSTSTEERNIALRRLQQGGGEGGKEIRVSTLSSHQVMDNADGSALLRDCESPVSRLDSWLTWLARKDCQVKTIHGYTGEGQQPKKTK
jgi:hypothetical protein